MAGAAGKRKAENAKVAAEAESVQARKAPASRAVTPASLVSYG